MTNTEKVLNLLSDGQIHFSAEFRDRLGLLEYRKRLSELRAQGYEIKSLKVRDGPWDKARPAYQLTNGGNGNA